MSAELDGVGLDWMRHPENGTAVSSRRCHELPASSCSGDAAWRLVVGSPRMLGPRLARRSWKGWRACPRGVSPAWWGVAPRWRSVRSPAIRALTRCTWLKARVIGHNALVWARPLASSRGRHRA